MDAEFLIVTVIGVISLLSAFPIVSEVRNHHPDYYKNMDNWGFLTITGEGRGCF